MLRLSSLLALAILAAVAVGCVQDRPARTGVFNENQYLRKDFLVRSGASGKAVDTGWMMKATVTQVSSPNPLGGDAVGLFPGMENGGALVRFRITQDKLELLNMRELTNASSAGKTEEVVNAWPATSVDLKYRVNLDGEKTNFFEENQELSWDVRQWVKLNFDKNDLSDVAPFGPYFQYSLDRCTDMVNSSTTLVPGSIKIDTKNDYLEWTVAITVPVKWDDAACVEAYGPMGQAAASLGRMNVTFNVMYSLVRANPTPTYQPLELAEKDPIRHKYGTLDYMSVARDEASGQLAARQFVTRFDPQKPIVWYFAEGVPDDYKKFFTDKGGVADQTNELLALAKVPARVAFKNFDQDLAKGELPRQYGDVRYNFIRWLSDRDTQNTFAGVEQFVTDPRTGEALSSSISLNDFAIKDEYAQRVDFYLQSVGASLNLNSDGEWGELCSDGSVPACYDKTDAAVVCATGQTPSCKSTATLGACTEGQTAAIVPADVATKHNTNSSVFGKMQEYLQKPAAVNGKLGPQDFIAKQDDDFYRAYFALLPYYVYADPEMNAFVTPEGQAGVLGPGEIWKMLGQEADFHALAADIDHGKTPFDGISGPNGLVNALGFLNKWRTMTLNHKDLPYRLHQVHARQSMDPPSSFSFESMMARDARHCVGGKWETKQQWTDSLIRTYWQQVAWHEFGHSLGLDHNFMASVDRNHFPTYQGKDGQTHVGLYASSVMEYNAAPDRVFAQPGWAPYDRGAIAWIYANSKPNGVAGTASISGQTSPTAPWIDPAGFDADGKEQQFLFCSHQHLRYTPLCRMGDAGTTPSEIIANDLDRYEWQYQWRNFRVYRKFWDDHAYADAPANMIVDLRRFLSLWLFDWSGTELADTLRRINITNPNPKGSDQDYYSALTDKFNKEASTANQMAAAFHKAIIQQTSGERPYKTTYDKYYGDVTQQGIILDKLFAMQGFVGLWPTDNYDQNQAGFYVSSYSYAPDSSYASVAEDVVASMVGGQYDVYPYFRPLAVAQFAQDTHDPSFGGRIEVRDWIGGHVFNRLEDFQNFFRGLAVSHNYAGCTSVATCSYDPSTPQTSPQDDHHSDSFNEFLGPDQRRWIWAYIANRNQWVAVDRDLNIASYLIVRQFTQDVVNQQDDGNYPGGAFDYELQVKYFLDAFNYYN